MRRFAEGGAPPTPEERALFRYPELRVTYAPGAPAPRLARAYGQLTWPGEYAVTITQPKYFRSYLLSQLKLLAEDYGAELSVRVSSTEIPYSFVLEAAARPRSNRAGRGAGALFQSAPHPVGDAVVDGLPVKH